MIEIILRKDLAEYEPRPLFGFTYRQIATAALIVASAVGIAWGLSALGVEGTPMLLAVVCVCGAEAFVGVGTVRGMRTEKWLAMELEERRWPRRCDWAAPRLSCASERIGKRRGRARRG